MAMILLAVFAPMLALTALLYWQAGRIEKRVAAAKDWPRAPGTVSAARVVRSRNNHWPLIQYEYLVAGRTHHGSRYGFVQADYGKDQAEAIVRAHPPGTMIEARYDPAKPSFAVLRVEGSGQTLRGAALGTGVATLVALAMTLLNATG